MATEVLMPQITMTMIEGVIAAWHKKKGEPVTEGEPLADIETDKVVQTLNASATGVFLEARAEVGDIVPVGKTICVIGESDEVPAAASASAQPPEALAQKAAAVVINVPQIRPHCNRPRAFSGKGGRPAGVVTAVGVWYDTE